MSSSSRYRCSAIAAAALTAQFALMPLALGQQLAALPVDDEERSNIDLVLGSGHSDNLFQDARNGTSGSYTAAGLALDVRQESRRTLVEIDGTVEHRNYSEMQIDDELYGALTANIEIQAVVDRLSWVFEDTYGEGRVDPFSNFGPANREQVNVFLTGPELFLPAGDRTEIRITGRVGERTYDKSPSFDGDITQVGIGLYRALSTTSDFGVATSNREIEYSDISLDNDISRVYLAYNKQFASGQATVAVGRNEVDFGPMKDSNPFVDIAWAREVGSRSRLNFAIQQQFVDSSDSFRGGRDFDDSLRSVDVYERTSVLVAYAIEGTRSRISIGGRIGEDTYESEAELNNDLTSFDVNFNRNISALLDFGIRVFVAKREFNTAGQTADDKSLTVSFDRSIGRRFSLTGEYRLTSRDGQGVREYTENTIVASLRYGLRSDD